MNLKAIARIAISDDGQELINYLEEISKKNYKELKYSSVDMLGIWVGRAQAIDEIKDFILSAEKECNKVAPTDVSNWST